MSKIFEQLQKHTTKMLIPQKAIDNLRKIPLQEFDDEEAKKKNYKRYFMMITQSCLMTRNILWRKRNPRKNLYSKMLKKQITINIDNDTVDFFKE